MVGSRSAMPPTDNSSPSPDLERRLGTWDATSLTIGSVIGTGIFITTADIARVLPSQGMILLVWIIGGVLTLAGALTYAELGALYPSAGGMYHYLKEAYGPLWGFLYGWAGFLIIMSGGIAALAVAFGEYLGSFLPLFSSANEWWSVPLGSWTWSVSGGQVAAALAILTLTTVNHIGLREGNGVHNLLTVLRIGSIVGFVALGFAVEAPVTFTLERAAPTGGLLAAIGVGMIAALW
ncbi:MAG: amino acid permease, partial [Thermoanaerobaculia bacterium]